MTALGRLSSVADGHAADVVREPLSIRAVGRSTI